jgi:hypothetical protein
MDSLQTAVEPVEHAREKDEPGIPKKAIIRE